MALNQLSSLATVIVTQRERFSGTRRSLESLYEHTRSPFDLIYVDGGSPRHVARYLASEASRRGFRLLRTDHYMKPHTARNLTIKVATGRYLAFVDNDVEFSDGWLEAMVDCAESTGAAVVTPLICIGEPVHTVVHSAGGTCAITEQDGRRRLTQAQTFEGRPFEAVRSQLVRRPTELAEFHVMLVRRALFDQMRQLDERYLEHLDFSLTVRSNGGQIFFEPHSVVTYVPPRRPLASDLPFYMLRWCDDWTRESEQYFHRKWGIEFDERISRFASVRRRQALHRLRHAALTLLGWRRGQWFSNRIDQTLVAIANRRNIKVARTSPSARS